MILILTRKGYTQASKQQGFTLAELVIGVALIGLLAMLALPSLFNTVGEAQNKAVFKSTIQQLRMVHEQITAEDTMSTTSTTSTLGTQAGIDKLWTRMDVVQTCNNQSDTQCKTIPISGEGMGAILKNGAHVFGLNPTSTVYDVFWMDANGPQAPNIVGKDVLPLVRSLSPGENWSPTDTALVANEILENGQIVLWRNSSYSTSGTGLRPANSQNADLLWDTIWK